MNVCVTISIDTRGGTRSEAVILGLANFAYIVLINIGLCFKFFIVHA